MEIWKAGKLLNYFTLQKLVTSLTDQWLNIIRTSKISTKFGLKNEEPNHDVTKQKSKPLNSSKKK